MQPVDPEISEGFFSNRDNNENLMRALSRLTSFPEDHRTFWFVAGLMLHRRDFGRLWRLCAEFRQRGHWSAYIPSAMAQSASSPQQLLESRDLLDDSVWLAESDLTVPSGFNESLARELVSHEALAELVPTRATAGPGHWLNHLEVRGGPLARELLKMTSGAVEAYFDARCVRSEHVMIAHAPDSVRLRSWATVLHGGGHEGWHVHPDGWISGVYYVQLPEPAAAVSRNAPPPGAIQFGVYPFESGVTDKLLLSRVIQPSVGKLLLFPSYFAHRTWPTGADSRRICVAFDVVPTESA